MNFRTFIKRIFFPEYCPFCDEIIPLNKRECDCLEGADYLSDDFCPHCANESCTCGNIDAIILPYVCGVFPYHGKIRTALHKFKFRNHKHFADYFGEKMALRVAQCFSSADFDLVCCVPMHKDKLKERGYNQCELLAKVISKRLFVPFENCLEKTKATSAQHKLSSKDRKTNLNGSFRVKSYFDIKGKTVLLCDDIKTTGATLSECVTVLKAAGAKEVYCVCAAVSQYGNVDFLSS